MNFEQIDALLMQLASEVRQLAKQTGTETYCHLMINVFGHTEPPRVDYRISVLKSGANVEGATRLRDLFDEYRRRSGWAAVQQQQALPAPAEVSFAPAAPPTDKPVPRVDTDDIAF